MAPPSRRDRCAAVWHDVWTLTLVALVLAGLPIYFLFACEANRVARVAVVPGVLSPAECAAVVDAALVAAEAQGGWATDRHRHYPTTDISMTKVPALVQLWESKLRGRVFAEVHRVFGLRPAQLLEDDLFVVRYDAAEGHQHGLVPHADRSHVSFNVALNRGFAGGGTDFVHFGPTVVHAAQPGQLLLHHSGVLHAGRNVTAGVRFILVGFLTVKDAPWHASLWNHWGMLATSLHLEQDDATAILPVDSTAALLSAIVRDSLDALARENPAMLVLLVGLVVLLVGLLAWLAYEVCCNQHAADDDDDDDGNFGETTSAGLGAGDPCRALVNAARLSRAHAAPNKAGKQS